MNRLFKKLAVITSAFVMAMALGGCQPRFGAVKVAKAASTSYDFSSGVDSSWTASKQNTGKEPSDRGAQWGTAVGTFTLTLSNSDSVSSVDIVASSNQAGNTLAVSVGGTNYGSSQSIASGTSNKNKTYSFSGSSSGNIVVTVSDSAKSVWIKSISVAFGEQKTVSSISLTKNDSEVKKAYYAGESASTSGLTVTATYDDETSEDVTSSATITANPATVALTTTSISYTASYSGKTSNSVTVDGLTVTKANPIQALYSKASGASVSDIYGYYVGKLDDSNIIIMDGEYGIDLYKKDAFASISYVENETILKVSGSISIFNGLYEIANATVDTVTSADVETPVVYATKGGETAEYASRTTTVTGIPSVVSGSLDGTAGSADVTLSFAVGSKSVQVFYKKGRQSDTNLAALKTAVTNSEEITIKGFTGWYNGFQVQMLDIVEAKADYTAAIFAQDLLDQTDAVCAGYLSDESKFNEIKTALQAIWSDLASADKYPSLPNDQKEILGDAVADKTSTDVVVKAMTRYDFLTGKYGLSQFINGRVIEEAKNINSFTANNNMLMIIIASISVISLASLTVLLKLKRKQR